MNKIKRNAQSTSPALLVDSPSASSLPGLNPSQQTPLQPSVGSLPKEESLLISGLQSIEVKTDAKCFKLSFSKQKFLREFSNEQRKFPEMTVQKYETITNDLAQKHSTTILVNGDGRILQLVRQRWLEDRREELSSDKGYADVRQAVSKKYLSESEGVEVLEMLLASADYTEINEIKSEKDASFADKIRRHSKYAALFAQAIEQAISDADGASLKIGLDTDSAAQDIADNVVPAAIRGKCAIGYMRPAYKSGEGIGAGPAHFDSLIALPNGRLVNPIYYNLDSCRLLASELDDNNGISVVATDLNKVLNNCSGPVPQPQAGERGCGSLSISYLKEYLKDGGAQMHDHCLLVDGIQVPGRTKPGSFLLPSPQVLRYSQSSHFNSVIQAMVDPEPSVKTLAHKGKTLSVRTLAKMLEAGSTISSIDGKVLNAEELDAFCKRWQDEFKISDAKRDGMTLPDGSLNTYLAHVRNRHVRRTRLQ